MTSENYLKTELYDALRTDARFFRFLEEASLDGLWYWDLENLENEWMSPTFWRLFGVDPATKTHHASEWQDIIHPDDLAAALENFNRHLEDPDHPYDQIVRYRHTDGSTVTVRCRGLIIRDEDGKPVRMLGAHNDLTELEVTRGALIDANANLKNELERSRNLSAAKTSFISMMSHEVRTPLNAIIGLFDLIAETSADDKQAERARNGLRAAEQLFQMLSGVLDAARLEGGATKAQPEHVETNYLADRARTLLEGASRRHAFGGEVSVAVADDAPPDLYIDVGILLQILTNLVDNAIKFSQGAPVEVRFESVSAERAGWLRVNVIDQGIGIAPEEKEQIFEEFFRSERNNVNKIGGSGLGLFIVKRLVEVLGGDIDLVSRRDTGTSFLVDIPARSPLPKEH